MKTIKRILVTVLSLMLIVATVSIKEVKANSFTEFTKLEIEDMQLNKARIKTSDTDSNGKHIETYWQQDPLDTFDKLTDITFARTVLKAPADGEYRLQLRCKNDSGSGSITVMVYVNGTPYEVNVSGSNYQSVSTMVTMNQGENSVVIAWVNWGYFDYINFPSDLEVVKQSKGSTYYASEAALNEIQLAPTTAFHAAKASLYTAPIEYNSGDEEWQGSATFTVDAAETIKSIDLHYYAIEYNNGKASLAMSVNGGEEVKIDLSGSATAEELVKNISQKTLTDAGFKPGESNTIKFRQGSSTGGQIGLYSIELKEDSVEETTPIPSKASRYESEGAYIIAGGKVKTPESEDESWSGTGYVGEFAATNITNPAEIDEYCSNVGYIQYQVEADRAGYYLLTLAYATEADMPIYVTSGYEWTKIDLSSTGSWNAIGEKQGYVYLEKGTNYIWVTGPTTEDAWVNYDYIEVEYAESGNIDTSKTVLFIDKEAQSENSEEITTVEGEEPSEDEEPEETSPKTGSRDIWLIALIMIALAGLYIYKTRRRRS